MASPTQWTWVWVSWWWTGRPGMLWFMGSQSRTRLSDWTELNWWKRGLTILKNHLSLRLLHWQRIARLNWCQRWQEFRRWLACLQLQGGKRGRSPDRHTAPFSAVGVFLRLRRLWASTEHTFSLQHTFEDIVNHGNKAHVTIKLVSWLPWWSSV